MSDVARTASEAWQQLKAKGGIEPKGRDKDFVEALTRALSPNAKTIEQALTQVDIDGFVAAMFETIGPFAAIYAEILAFFRRANAASSKDAITLELNEIPFDLGHFTQFIETAQTVLGIHELVLLSDGNAWGFRHALGRSRHMARAPALAPDVDHWCKQWQEGVYAPYPASLIPARMNSGLRDAAAIANAALQTLRVVSPTKDDTRRLLADIPADATTSLGGLDAHTIANLERDYWLFSVIESLGQAAKLTADDQADIVDAVANVLNGLPRTPVDTALSQLEMLVSLPAWKKRYDLYAVWVATVIISALPNHTLEIHAKGGILPFAFKKTLLATIEAIEGQAFLYSERQAELANPRGKSRKDHVQPDYSLWRPDDHCRLVIEVKHYKTPDKRKFSEVLADYADAHPHAQVVLVNYAGTGDILDAMPDVDADTRDRCRHISNLTPYNLPAKARLQQMVRDSVGLPARALSPHKLLVDVSGSMDPAFRGGRESVMASWMQSDEVDPAAEVVFVGTEESWRGNVKEAVNRLRNFSPAGGTSLCESAIRLLEHTDRLLVATDDGGLADLETDPRLKVERLGFRTSLWAAWTMRAS